MGSSIHECIQTRKPETLFQGAEKQEKKEGASSKKEEAEASTPPDAPAPTDCVTPSAGLYPTLRYEPAAPCQPSPPAYTCESTPPATTPMPKNTNPFLPQSAQMPVFTISSGSLTGEWEDPDGNKHRVDVIREPPLTATERQYATGLGAPSAYRPRRDHERELLDMDYDEYKYSSTPLMSIERTQQRPPHTDNEPASRSGPVTRSKAREWEKEKEEIERVLRTSPHLLGRLYKMAPVSAGC